MIITTSWDDGHKLDLKLSDLLKEYNLKGTFYVSKTGEFRTLSDSELRELAKTNEIGAHALTHNDLTNINPIGAEKEIINSKKYLEDLLGRPIKMFSYPRGKYNDEIKKMVKQAGFAGARTVEEFCFGLPADLFEIGTTIHLYPFPFRKRDKDRYHLTRFLFQPVSRKFFKIVKLRLPASSFLNWPNLAINLFDYACKTDSIYHLWGHSWEIEKYDMWKDLEKVFGYIANRDNVKYLNNSTVVITRSPRPERSGRRRNPVEHR